MLTSKKGISALQIHQMLGYGPYETAWYMCMRRRAAIKAPDFQQLMAIVEVDETFIGGKAANNARMGSQEGQSRGTKGKVAVLGVISVRAMSFAR
jgi:hypothetical protein